MTVEIAIMNRKGIALAADSAVTTRNGGKVYHSVDKLFEISSSHPVGMMVYGTDKMLQVPWETIINVYRGHLGDKHFDTLEQYTEDFMHFLMNNDYEDIFTERSEIQFTCGSLDNEVINIYEELSLLKENIYREFSDLYNQNELDTKYFEEGEIFLSKQLRILKKKYVGEFNYQDFTALIENYSQYVERMIDERFKQGMLKDKWFDKIKIIACNAVLKKMADNRTGIVFAGFGEKEVFPSVMTFYIEGKLNGKIKYQLLPNQSKKIGEFTEAAIIPFAQVDTVTAFVNGMDHKIENFSLSKIKKMIGSLPNKLVEQLKDELREESDLEKIELDFRHELIEMHREFHEAVHVLKQNNYINPIMDTVDSLPNSELAKMAETLVSLTSFQRKKRLTTASIGGPIDVAIITKGDGFVWVKKNSLLTK